MFQHNFSFPDGSFFQYGENFQTGSREETGRLEFNPNKCTWKIVHNIIRRLKFPKITRLDVAIDYYNIDLSEFDVIGNTARKCEKIFSRSGKLETFYHGSRHSDIFTRIYDKAKESQKNKLLDVEEEIQSDLLWWRVEAVIKDFDEKKSEWKLVGFDEQLNEGIFEEIPLSDQQLFANPFNFIFAKRKLDFINNYLDKDCYSPQEKAMMFYLSYYPDEINSLSKNTAKRYKDFLFKETNDLLDWHLQPNFIFEQNKAALQIQITDWLQAAIDNGHFLIGRK
jgi:hypothetical protein